MVSCVCTWNHSLKGSHPKVSITSFLCLKSVAWKREIELGNSINSLVKCHKSDSKVKGVAWSPCICVWPGGCRAGGRGGCRWCRSPTVQYSTLQYSVVQYSTVQVTSVAETQQVSSQWLVSRQRGHHPPGWTCGEYEYSYCTLYNWFMYFILYNVFTDLLPTLPVLMPRLVTPPAVPGYLIWWRHSHVLHHPPDLGDVPLPGHAPLPPRLSPLPWLLPLLSVTLLLTPLWKLRCQRMKDLCWPNQSSTLHI